ncbi:MAG: DUF1501 domain-containing protein [Henriciella sp.]|nr:DUF1501 domain-containing protein [Henriciella sp.]
MANLSRRHFMAGSGALGFAASLGALSSIGASRAWAANTSGYKALVCVFLKGGMDHADTILPYDQASYDELAAVRSGLFGSYNATASDSSRNRANLLQLNAENAASLGGRSFALPPELAPLHDMFDAGDLAVLGNVGPLIEPTTRAQMENKTAILPKRLFSHNDQQSTWMSFGVEGQRVGWGGRFIDASLASSPGIDARFAAISASSNDVFLSGGNTQPFRVSSGGAPQPTLLRSRNYIGGSSEDDEARERIRAFLARGDVSDGNIFAQDLRAANADSIEASERLRTAQDNVSELATLFGDDPFSKQMKTVAETIQLQPYLNVPRQIFYVSSGGFDTHSGQVNSLGGRHSGLAAAMSSFKSAMQELNRWNDVTVFTMSDFGRTLNDNGDGTDHGWGGHHFIAGGGVQGRRIYGDLPGSDIDSASYTPSRGRLIPSVSVEQYAATLGQWFGLTNSELNSALPNLQNFDNRDLGFFNASGV